jgi:hypothetical protein
VSLLHHDARHEAFDFTSHFREDLYTCLTRRGDTLFELCDAMLCEDGPVTSPVDLTLLAEHRRGHGALYDALNQGRIDAVRLRKALAVLPQPKAADGRLVLAVDVSAWLRPDAPCSPDRLFCHIYGRSGERVAKLKAAGAGAGDTARGEGWRLPSPAPGRHSRADRHQAQQGGAGRDPDMGARERLQVADGGVIRKTVVDAYDAAHRTTNLAEAG